MQKRDFDADEFELSVADGLSYQYTGDFITLPTDKVTFKEKDDVLSGADLSAAVKKAVTTDKTTGMQTVTVTLDANILPNFNLTNQDKTQITTKANVEITKRDLNADSTSITLKYGRVPQGTSVDQFAQYNLVFKDKSGTELKLTNNSDYTLINKDQDNQTLTSTQSFNKIGTYIVTISANEQSNPTCKNGQTLDVRVASNVIATASITNTYAPYYTGTELKPTKEELGKLVISNVNGTVANETLKDDEWEITGYSNNVEASKYDKNGDITTYGYVEIKVKGDSSYAGQTYKVPFEIKPLTVSADSVTVPKTVTYNKGIGPASDYKVQLVVTAKDKTGKIVKGLSADDYSIKYEYEDGLQGSMSNDFVIYRYADVLMMEGEALVRMGKATEALPLFNEVRRRAGVAEYTASQLTLDEILAERWREFAWEGLRRQDQIRFGTWGKSWDFKEPSEDYKKLYPIPYWALLSNPTLQQEPGYTN